MPHLLGIDIGTSGTKTLICDHRGKVVATATAPHPISQPKPGWSEQNPLDWWNATIRATRQCLKFSHLKPADISAIGLSGQMHGSVFLANGTRPLRPALLWNDQRTAEQCAEIESKAGGRSRLIELVGNPALAGFTAPKILWVRQHQPRIYEKTRHILLPKDFIRLCLTSDYATEVSDASGTLLLDVANRTWSSKILSALDIDPALLPHLHESPEITGELTRDAARALNLRPGIPVVGGAADNAAGAVGSGVVRPGIVSASLGTSGVIFAHAEIPQRDPDGRVHTMCHAVPGQWCVFGCMLAAGGSLQWFRNNLAKKEIAQARKLHVDPYELLIEQAEQSPPGSHGVQFLPYLTGERCPHPDPKARGAWIGLTSQTTRPDLIRALLEGVTFGMRDALEIIRALGLPVSQIRATGGGARGPFWQQLQSDIYNAPVITTNAEQGPAYGAALLAGVGIKCWSTIEQAADACIKPKHHRTPNRKLVPIYQKAYEIYRSLYPTLKERMHELAEL